MCVWLKFEHGFSTLSSPGLKCSSPALNVFASSAKSVCLQNNKHVCLVLESWFRNPPETKERLCKTSFQLWMGLKNIHKQGRDERMQETALYLLCSFCRCWVVVLRSFIFLLFLYFFPAQPKLKWSSTKTFFPSLRLYYKRNERSRVQYNVAFENLWSEVCLHGSYDQRASISS